MLDKRGFIFTLDALFALMLAITFLVYTAQYLAEPKHNPYNELDLLYLSNDALGALENAGILSTSVNSLSVNILQNYLNALPPQVCGSVTIFSTSQTQILAVNKTGCSVKQNDFEISRRVFVTGTSTALAQMEVWYK